MTTHQSHIKIAYFIGSLNRGGTEMLTLDICRRKDISPYDMILIYRNDGDMTELFRETGVPMIRIKPNHHRYISYLWQLRQVVRKEHVDIVHAQTVSNGIAASLFLFGTGIKLVTSFHGFFVSFKDIIMRHIVMWRSDALIYVSDYVRKWYETHSWCNHSKNHMVYNGINFSKIDYAEPSMEFAQTHTRIRLAMIGNFVKGRSQMVVVRALERLDAMRLDSTNLEPEALDAAQLDFYFIGRKDDSEPERYDDCVKYCETHGLKNVHFLGSRSDVPSLLKSMDGFVYSTDHDTFGIGVVEAMAAGLPIVVNDWPVMKEVCGEASAAVRYYRTRDVVDGANVIAAFLGDMENSKRVAKESMARVHERFSIEKHIENLYSIYKSI